MITLETYLERKEINLDLIKIITSLARASKYVNAEIRMKDTEKCGDENVSGDVQSKLDIESDKIIHKHLKDTNIVKTIASEEKVNVAINSNSKKDYFIAYDPYDGGSVGDVNITFGSIFGIWSNNPFNKTAGSNLVASCYALYGPKVTFVFATNDDTVALFELNEVGDFLFIKDNFSIAKDIKTFSPGNLKATLDSKAYKNVLDSWISSGKKLRYTGALVTDINHILLKGNGIFTYPADKKNPNGRLRLLYEGIPLGYILKCAGGCAMTEEGVSLFDLKVTDYHQTASFVLGSKNEVNNVTKTFQKFSQ